MFTDLNNGKNFSIDCSKDGMTKQAFTDECNINLIMARFVKTGSLPDLIKQNPVYGDFSTGNDYDSACEIIKKANEQFNALPAEIRIEFENDPAQFLDFVNNPDNLDELITMGLANPKPIPDIQNNGRLIYPPVTTPPVTTPPVTTPPVKTP